ncbi:MAG: hypothetical protein ACPG41_06795 [Lacinutrix venerupis]
MKKIMFIALTLLITLTSYSQGSANPMQNLSGPAASNDFRNAFDAVNSRGQWMTSSWKTTVKGTPLALEDNCNLVIFTKDDKVYKIENGNYNAKLDKLVTEYTKDSIYVFGDKNIAHAKLDNVVLRKFNDTESNKSRFHFVLSQGEKLTLTKAYFSTIKEGTINVMTKLKETSDKYILNDDYYISKDNSTVEKIRLKKKHLLNVMSDAKKEIADYVKRNDLSYKEEDDVIKIIKYYNTL